MKIRVQFLHSPDSFLQTITDVPLSKEEKALTILNSSMTVIRSLIEMLETQLAQDEPDCLGILIGHEDFFSSDLPAFKQGFITQDRVFIFVLRSLRSSA